MSSGIFDPDKLDGLAQMFCDQLIERYEAGLLPPGLVVKVESIGRRFHGVTDTDTKDEQ